MTNLIERIRTAKERKAVQDSFDDQTSRILEQAQSDKEAALAAVHEQMRIQTGDAFIEPTDPKKTLAERNSKELEYLKHLVDLTGFADIFHELMTEFSDQAVFDLWRINWSAKATEKTPNNAVGAFSGFIFQAAAHKVPVYPASEYLDYYDQREGMDYSTMELFTGTNPRPKPYQGMVLPDNSFYFLLFTPTEIAPDKPQIPRIFIGEIPPLPYSPTLSEILGIEDIKYNYEVNMLEYVAKQHVADDPIAQAYLKKRGGRSRLSFENEVKAQQKKGRKKLKLQAPHIPSRERDLPFFPSQLPVLNELFFQGQRRRLLTDRAPGPVYQDSIPFFFDEHSLDLHRKDVWAKTEKFLRKIPPIDSQLTELCL